jgi:hypothetical protein
MAQEPQQTIHRVGQMVQFGKPMTEEELVTAAGVLGMYPARWEASQARTEVVQRLRELGYDVDTEDDGDEPADDGDGAGATDENAVAPPAGTWPPVDAMFQAGARPRRPVARGVVRVVGAGLLAATAMALWFGMAPDEIPGKAPVVSAALANYASDNRRAEGAPQQTVVNGWIAKDLLTIVIQQGDQAALAERQASDRLAAEAALIVVAVGFGIATRNPARP